MATGGDRSDIEFLPLEKAKSRFFGFPARGGRFTGPCLLGLIGLHTGTNMNSIVLLPENLNIRFSFTKHRLND